MLGGKNRLLGSMLGGKNRLLGSMLGGKGLPGSMPDGRRQV
jgi:hypothetical protein